MHGQDWLIFRFVGASPLLAGGEGGAYTRRSILRQPSFYVQFIRLDLSLQRFQAVQFFIRANKIEYFYGQGLTVQIAVKVEDVYFNDLTASVLYSGPMADVKHSTPLPPREGGGYILRWEDYFIVIGKAMFVGSYIPFTGGQGGLHSRRINTRWQNNLVGIGNLDIGRWKTNGAPNVVAMHHLAGKGERMSQQPIGVLHVGGIQGLSDFGRADGNGIHFLRRYFIHRKASVERILFQKIDVAFAVVAKAVIVANDNMGRLEFFDQKIFDVLLGG